MVALLVAMTVVIVAMTVVVVAMTVAVAVMAVTTAVAVMLIAIIDRLQEVLEGPVGDVLTLLTRRGVRETEVDAQVDAGVDHVLSRVRESAVGARLLDRLRRVTRD